MNTAFKLFFKTLRIAIGPLMLLWEHVNRPSGQVRSPEAQQRVDLECRALVLYQFRTCPFCIKVRQEIRRLSLPIEFRNAQPEGPDRDALARGGGIVKVPCLKITDATGRDQWLYESGAIIAYLRGRFDNA